MRATFRIARNVLAGSPDILIPIGGGHHAHSQLAVGATSCHGRQQFLVMSSACGPPARPGHARSQIFYSRGKGSAYIIQERHTHCN